MTDANTEPTGREYDRLAMEARSPARYLAPIALVATIAGTYLIVHHGATRHGSAAAAVFCVFAAGEATARADAAGGCDFAVARAEVAVRRVLGIASRW